MISKSARISTRIRRSVMDAAVGHLAARVRLQSNLWIDPTVRRAGTAVDARTLRFELERDTVVVFADDQPAANWAHPCRYLLHDARTGELYRAVEAIFPPGGTEIPSAFTCFHRPVVLWPAPKLHVPVVRKLCIRRRENERYAILFSGDSNNRHVNDMEFLYRTLVDVYGFDTDKIYVLNHDGTLNYNGAPHPVISWPGDNSAYRMVVTDKGSKEAFDAAIDDLKTRIKKDDLLLIHTNNHGYNNGTDSLLCTYNSADYAAPAFAAKLAELPAFRHLVVMMEQCNSGGFIQPILGSSPAAHTSVATAVPANKSSWGYADFDYFARDWIAAMAGHDPAGGALGSNPDVNNDGHVGAEEAFTYADGIAYVDDDPQYGESDATAGDTPLSRTYSYLLCRLYTPIFEKRYFKLPPEERPEWVKAQVIPVLDRAQAAVDASATELRRALTDPVFALAGARIRA